MKKRHFPGIMPLMMTLISGLVLLGCSDITSGQPTKGIPPDLRNTSWSRQISNTETVTISFGANVLTMSSNIDSSQYNREWEYLGASCCGYGYCGFYSGSYPLDFRYACRDNGLTITRCNMQSLNGNWTRR